MSVAEGSSAPLANIRVVELSTGLAGGYAAKLFADAGADVVKVEPPEGDSLRRWSASGARPRGSHRCAVRVPGGVEAVGGRPARRPGGGRGDRRGRPRHRGPDHGGRRSGRTARRPGSGGGVDHAVRLRRAVGGSPGHGVHGASRVRLARCPRRSQPPPGAGRRQDRRVGRRAPTGRPPVWSPSSTPSARGRAPTSTCP